MFFLQDFVALLWSAQACLRFKGDGTFPPAPKRQQAAALQREAQWGVILLLVAPGLLRVLSVSVVNRFFRVKSAHAGIYLVLIPG